MHSDDVFPSPSSSSPSPEFPAEDLGGMERQILADSAAWERGVPASDTLNARLRRRLAEESMDEQEIPSQPTWLTERPSTGVRAAPREPGERPPSRTRTLLAVAAAIVIVGLLAAVFADLTHGRAGHGPAASATATATPTPSGPATPTITAATASSAPTHMLAAGPVVTQQPGTPLVAPSDPNVVYEYADNGTGIVLRRSDDGGQMWSDLRYPGQTPFLGAIELAVSPVDAHNVFLRLDLGYQPGAPNPCQAIGETPHGGVLASAGLNCRVEFSSRDGGASWSRIRLPVAGTLFQSGVTFAYDPTTIQAGASELYGRVWQYDASGSQNGDLRIVSTRDDAQTWQAVDTDLLRQAGHVCAFSAAPGTTTLFAIGSTTTCWANPAGDRSVWRSDDAGAHWLRAGDLPVALATPDSTILAASDGGAQGTDATLYGFPGAAATRGAFEVQVSGDGGQTWHTAPTSGLLAGAQTAGVGGTPLADGSILVMVGAAAPSGQQAEATAGPTATPVPPSGESGAGGGDGPQSGAIGYVWKAGQPSWRQVTPAATIKGPSISNIFVSNGSRLVVTLSIANDMSSNPTYTLERFQ